MLRPDRGILTWLALVVVLSGCSRLTFIKPDYTRNDYRRTAPELDVTTDTRGEGSAEARSLILQGQNFYTRGDLDGARDAARKAVSLAPDSAAAHTLGALVADRSGKARDAGEHYLRAVELAPHEGGMLNNYGTWLCANGRVEESLQWFDRALADTNYRTPAAAMANAGACADQAGQGERAARYLESALELQPDNPVALGAMAAREFRAGRAFHARAFSQRRLAAAPADADALMLASQIEKKLGDNAAAAKYVQRLRTEFPDESGSGTGDDGKR